ncbi:MAG TPA: hypothetical protein VHQ41_01900 [Patescibacteria group bacterium]|jgi:hypothetical protein|nr:hypothetical protein [Patescibacteria group bacterium]
MSEYLDRTSTVIPPHTAEDTELFFESIQPDAPSEPVAKQPWFPDPKNNVWERDFFLEQTKDAAAINLAVTFPESLDRVSTKMVADAFREVGPHVKAAKAEKRRVVLTFEHSPEKFKIRIDEMKTKAQAALGHLTG